MACAVNDGITLRTVDFTRKCSASLNHLLLVVNALRSSSFLQTIRGRSGGLRLSCPPARISMGAVFRVLEGGTPFTECFSSDTNTCPLSGACRLRAFVARAVEAFCHELDMVTLDDLTRGNCGLQDLLAMPETLHRPCTEVALA